MKARYVAIDGRDDICPVPLILQRVYTSLYAFSIYLRGSCLLYTSCLDEIKEINVPATDRVGCCREHTIDIVSKANFQIYPLPISFPYEGNT